MTEVKEIPIGKIKAGEHEQRAKELDVDLDGLVSSISRLGLVYPLVVAPKGDGFLLVEGHRRLAACKRLGLSKVRCLVTDTGKEDEAEIAFAGNFFRKDLSPVELACALKDCNEKGTMTIGELAAGFHKSKHWVQQMIAIAAWPPDVQEAIHEKVLSVSAAANLAVVTDDTYRVFLLRNAVEQGATARTTASWLQAWRAMQPQEEAITAEPVQGQTIQIPAVPQAPCLCCGQIFKVNEMSHVPVCGACVQIIRQIGRSGGE